MVVSKLIFRQNHKVVQHMRSAFTQLPRPEELSLSETRPLRMCLEIEVDMHKIGLPGLHMKCAFNIFLVIGDTSKVLLVKTFMDYHLPKLHS